MSGFEDFLSSQAAPQAAGATTAPTDALAPPDDFGAFMAKAKGEQNASSTMAAAQATTVANAHSGVSATQASQNTQIGKQIGLPAAVVQTDPTQFQAQAKAQQNSAIVAQNPVLAQWVAANPDGAHIAQDEYDKLGTIEKMWGEAKDFGFGLLKGVGGSYNSLMHAAAMQFGAHDAAAKLEADAKSTFAPNPDASIGEKAGEFVGGFGGVMSQAVLGGEAVAPILGAFGVASTAGAMSAGHAAGVMPILGEAATQAVKYMSVPAWSAAVNKFHEVLGQTGDVGAASRAATVAQGMNLLQGAVPFSLPGGLGTRLASGFASGVATSEGQRAALNLVLPESMQQSFDLKEAMAQGAQSALLGGLLGPRADPNYQAAIRKTYDDAARAAAAQRDFGKVATLGQIAAGSELRKADPDAFKAFVQQVTDKTDLNSIYVDSNKLQAAYHQAGIDVPNEISGPIADAQASGTDVQIPIADYATHIAGTPVEKAILPDMKVEPDGMTMTEGRKYYQDQVATLQAEAQKVMEQKAQDTEFQASGQKVEDYFQQQGDQANRYPAAVNKLHAKLMRAFFETSAIRETELQKAQQAEASSGESPSGVPGETPAPAHEFVIDNPLGGDEPMKVRVIRDKNGNTAISDGHGTVDITTQLKGGMSVERAIAGTYGDHPQGTEPDVSKVHAQAVDGKPGEAGATPQGQTPARRVLPHELMDRYQLQVLSEMLHGRGTTMDQPGTLADLRQQLDSAGVKNSVSENNGVITLSQLVVPEGERNSGKGTAAMKALVQYADATGQHIALSPSADFGGNKARLVKFYKQFGFVENKGKNRAFTTSESMYRQAPGMVLHQSIITKAVAGIRNLLGAASEPGNKSDKVQVAPAQEWLVHSAHEAGLEIEGFTHAVDTSAIRHIRKSHGDVAAEEARGQVAVTDADFESIPDVISTPDKVVFGTENRIGRDQIGYLKKMADGSTLYLEEVRTGKRELAAQSMRKYPATMNAESILSTLDLYAQGDGGSKLIVVDAPSHGNTLDQPAYHGSPYSFERFDSSNIGNGEGNQSYGHGLYFAENKGVAEGYRKKMSSGLLGGFERDGKTLTPDEALAKYFEPGRIIHGFGGRDKVLDFKPGKDGSAWSVQVQHVDADGKPKAGERPRWHSTRPDAAELERVLAVDGWKPQEKGSIYQVDVPDEHVANFLHWDKPLAEQPHALDAIRKLLLSDKVEQRALNDFDVSTREELADKLLDPKNTGEDLYGSLSDVFGTDKKASQALDGAGVKGIKYLDGSSRGGSAGTHNLVVFDDKIINLTHKDGTPVSAAERTQYLQGTEPAQPPRGQISFSNDITQSPSVISLLQHADLSTFVHESGHFYFEVLNHMAGQAGAESSFGKDLNAVLSWMGVKDAATWNAMTAEQRRPFHEQFARGFEAYLLEGKAPSAELQPMFGRFRSWLLNVYKSIKQLGVQLTPEVRSVFDRMLASDEAISHQERMRSYAPLFDNAKAAGMSVEDFNRYLDLGKQATEQAVSEIQTRSIEDMKWASNAKNKVLRALQRQADAARKEVAAKVENEVSQDPAFAAQDYMREHAPKADPEAHKEWTERRDAAVERAKQQAKDELAAANPEAKGIVKGQLFAKNKASLDNRAQALVIEWEKANEKPQATGGADPELVAGMFGFPSGDAMRRAIMEAGSKKDAIKLLTDQRMLQEHGELTDPQSMEQAANEAVHNEARSRFMATGLKALTKSELPANQIAKAAKQVAEEMIAAKRAGELDPRVYLAAEARAGKEALAAAATDPAKAIEAQRAALLNNRLAKATIDAKAEIQKGLEYLKKFDKLSVAKALGADYMDRINELLAQYDVTNRLNTRDAVATRMQFRDWLQSEFQSKGVMPEVSDKFLNWAQKTHWKELSVEDFRGLVDSVKSLEHVGRAQMEVTINGQRVALQDLVDRAKADMATLPHSDPVDVQPHLLHAAGLNKINAQWLNFKQKVRGMDAALIKMEQLFQWLTYGDRAGLGETRSGPFLEMFQRAGDAEGAERAMRADSTQDLMNLHEILKDAKVNLDQLLEVDLPRKGRGKQWYREELLAAALNTGNEGNLKKMLEGYGWNERLLMDALNTHLSPAEWKFVQGVWDSIGKYGSQIAELQRRQTGVTPDMVQPRTVHTNHGDLAGGYYPVVYDSFLDTNIDTKQAKNSDMLFENQWAKPTTSKGHTIDRTGYVGPVHLSLGVIARHIDQVTHDLAWRETIIDMNKFLSHSEIMSEVDKTMGREYRKQFRPWLQAMANDKVFNTTGDSAWENFYRTVRTNTTLVGLGFRMSTMMIHGSSAMSNSIGEVGVKWFAKGAAQFATPERWEAAKQFMFERSPEMANRFNEHDRNVNEAIRAINEHQRSLGPVSATQKAVDGARKFAFYGVSALDMASAAPTWYAAYLKGMAKAADGGLDMAETEAVDYANRAVRNAHGGGGVKDLSAVQRDKGVMSMATMFYSFWNHMYNRQRDLGKGYANLPESFKQGTGTRDFAKLLARSWWYFVIPQLIHAALKPSPPGQQEEDGIAGTMKHMAEEVALGFVSGVPVLRDLANAAVNGRDYTITPLEQAGKSVVKAAVDTTKYLKGEEPSAHAGKNMAQAAGYALGLPTGQLSATGSFLWDVYHGDTDPQGIREWYTGIQNGRISD